ncbi:hypothetical protein D3C81_1663580 [compost metagenome]
MALQHRRQGLQHQLSCSRIGEVGEDDNQGATPKLARQGGQSEGVVGLVRRVVDPPRHGLQGAEGIHTAQGAGRDAGTGVKGEEARPVAAT